MKPSDSMNASRPTFDDAGNKKVPLKKDAHGNDVPQTRGAAPIDPNTPVSKR